LQHSVLIFQNIRIPGSKHAIALGFEPAVAFDIFGRLGMLSAIDLNDELMIVANKIHNETPNQGLSTEAQSFQSVAAQCGPQTRLGIRHLLAQGFGTSAIKRRNRTVSGF
jgi:hypothetical protein